MTKHEAQQLQRLKQFNDLFENLDPDHLAEAQKRVNRSIEIRKRQAHEQALAEIREISRRYGVPLRELAEQYGARSYSDWHLAAYAAADTYWYSWGTSYDFLAAYAAADDDATEVPAGSSFLAAYAAADCALQHSLLRDIFLAAYAAADITRSIPGLHSRLLSRLRGG